MLCYAMQAAYVAQGKALRARLDALLDDGKAVLVVPSVLSTAPRHHENLLRFTSAAQTGLFNVTEHAATALPLGMSADGLPLGCQVVA